MVYHSEVFFGIQKKQIKELQKILLNLNIFYDEYEEYEECDNILIYRLDQIRWLHKFDHVKEITSLVKKYPDQNFIVCVGEDNEIHSSFGNWNKYLELKIRQITFELK